MCFYFVKTTTTLSFKSLLQQTHIMHCTLEMTRIVFAGPLESTLVCVLPPAVLKCQKVSE